MLANAEAIELEEDLADIEASVGDLITAEEVEDMASVGKAWDFGPSLMTKDMIKVLEEAGCFSEKKAKPLQGETVPKSLAVDVIIFRDFFAYGLRLLAIDGS